MAGASVNKVILVGNLGRDPELKYTPSGMAVATFTVATTSGGGRDREATTEWHRIVVWEKQAELCSQYLTKGRQVYIEGRLQTRSWDDKQTGQKRSTTEVVANQVVFLGGGDRSQGPNPNRPAPRGEQYGEGQPQGQGPGQPPGQGQGPGQGPGQPQGQGQGQWASKPPAQPQRGGYDSGPADFDELPPSSFNEDDDIPF